MPVLLPGRASPGSFLNSEVRARLIKVLPVTAQLGMLKQARRLKPGAFCESQLIQSRMAPDHICFVRSWLVLWLRSTTCDGSLPHSAAWHMLAGTSEVREVWEGRRERGSQ